MPPAYVIAERVRGEVACGFRMGYMAVPNEIGHIATMEIFRPLIAELEKDPNNKAIVTVLQQALDVIRKFKDSQAANPQWSAQIVPELEPPEGAKGVNGGVAEPGGADRPPELALAMAADEGVAAATAAVASPHADVATASLPEPWLSGPGKHACLGKQRAQRQHGRGRRGRGGSSCGGCGARGGPSGPRCRPSSSCTSSRRQGVKGARG